MNRSLSRTLTSSLLAVCGVGVALGCIACQSPRERVDGSDWPVFLGPTGDGKSSETGILKHWNEDGPALRWHMPVGEGYAAPSIADNRILRKALPTVIPNPRSKGCAWKRPNVPVRLAVSTSSRLGR